MRFVSLFAGIGGVDLGLERAGWTSVGQVELDPYCRAVLAKHWPNVQRWEDVRDVSADDLRGLGADAIVGGFPCQDISSAGKGAGIDGARSGLWSEMFRLVRELRPRWVLAENSAALRTRGADRVLGDLEAAGYAAWAHVVGACHVGARHRRMRAWIAAILADGDGERCEGERGRWILDGERPALRHDFDRRGLWPAWSGEAQHEWEEPRAVEPEMGVATDGVPGRLARRNRRAALKALGNSVVPQVVEVIGRAILHAS